MKIIHTADLHLDSAMKTNLSKEDAKTRKNEILNTFERMVDFAKKNDVKVILIAGDLFDTKTATRKTKNVITRCIEDNPQIDFLYLKGNHDKEVLLYEEAVPENLKLFGDEWTTYEYDNVKITGANLSGRSSLYSSLLLNSADINIVTLHGQELKYSGKDKTETINIPLLKNHFIDYLALGHVHSYKEDVIDNRGKWVYSGCPDGRGYDECGVKGFVLIDITDGILTYEFIEFQSRMIEEVSVDISDSTETTDVDRKISEELKKYSREDMIKVKLKGKVSVEASYDISYLEDKYKDNFFAFKIDGDDVGLKFNIEDYMHSSSLKGEFIRTVLSEDYSEEEKRAVIELGIRALSGEEV